ncbi:MAG: hypothetical protein P4L49_02765 [Desulfosporosinus sp.]|nr:hypothetical protein [Desulfosporosinus sp.]
MKKLIKSVILSTTLTLAFTLPAFAEGTINSTDPTQQIANLRIFEIPCNSSIAFNGRIFDLITELQIHKLKVEPDITFTSNIQNLMIAPSGNVLSLEARQLDTLILLSSYGIVTDDEAMSQARLLMAEQDTLLTTLR